MSLIRGLIDLLYPPRCLICGAFDEAPLCSTCLSGFTRVSSPKCTICGEPFADGIPEDHVCEQCLRRRPFFEVALAPYLYEGPIMDAIHRFKYGGKTQMVKGLGPLLASFGRERLSDIEAPLIIPVPLHPRRLRRRGYNQSLLLSRQVARALGGSLDLLSLRRIRDTQVQAGLGRDERRMNVRRAFEVVDRKAVRGKTILLIDDVATTGSTLNECARVLKKAGSGKVLCLVLARAPKGSKQ